MNYLMVVPVEYYRLNENTVALESAFAEHLQLLRKIIAPIFNQFSIAMIEMKREDYEKRKFSLATLNEEKEGITFFSLTKASTSNNWIKTVIKFYLFDFIDYLKTLIRLVKSSDLIHSGPSDITQVPVFLATLIGFILRKPTVFVVDIDFRNSPTMAFKMGQYSWKSYLLRKYIYDSLLSFQVKLAVSLCSLALLKGKQLCEDYGKGRPNVKNFLDAAYSKEYIIKSDSLNAKIAQVKDPQNALELVYFGRLTGYKGIDKCLQALAIAKKHSQLPVIFHIIGAGEQEQQLKQLTYDLNLENNVLFHGAYPYGIDLFEKLYRYHLLLAAPLREDTPRSALDAMAAGVSILAFDTYYYKDLEDTEAVVTVPWLDVEKFGEKIAELNNNRSLIAAMMAKSVSFAYRNTQEIWLNKRFQWTVETFSPQSNISEAPERISEK